ncbi:hypothetical protein IMG5_084110 [Ichthyophthirius multifiliis]|uniref:Uncharacterized protein n=1 Tax=Ichthyophthirius multifiliis TaxID=5932 RepID=G0QQU8_ICHMU|nr:hypothetical protein IMG5_084110 [Ichthyophthirius multifiliis]EGR32410.1 hypothetical protein IMG5_084110 [Ichthyophthirius multifiliis]|eukprot:XP_004036396.1 hypothetical protein IMG5_084110 [Ichthyophthirius multifiliis]
MSSVQQRRQNYKNQSISEDTIAINNMYDDFDDYDVNILNMKNLYTTKFTQNVFIHNRDSIISAQETFKKVFNNTIKKAQENHLNRQLPEFSFKKSLAMVENQLSISLAQPDTQKYDYQNEGLIEDQEPNQLIPDTWLRARVIINTIYKDEENEQRLPLSKAQDAQSKRISSKASSIGGGYHKKMQDQEPKNNNNMIPTPIDLTENLNFSITEEKLRLNKENQKKEKEEKIRQEEMKRKAMILVEQQKYNKFQKENKASGFTYDFNGDLLSVNKIKIHKLPPHAYAIEYTFKEEPKPPKVPQKKKKAQNNNLPEIQKLKKTPDQEKEFAKLNTLPPPILDNIGLSTGVTLTFDGRQRTGPRPNTVDMQSLTSGVNKVRMGKSQYEELIKNGGFNRGIKNDQQQYKNTNNFERENVENNMLLKSQKQTNLQEKYDQVSKNGSIKINSAKIYETFTQKMDDSFEENSQPNIQQKQQQFQEISLKQKKISPIDEFNIQISKQQEWGKTHYGMGSGNTISEKFQVHRPSEKDLITSIGANKYKPRDRLIYTPFIVPTFGLRASTSEGFFRKNIITSESNRNVQKTSEGVRKKGKE